MTRASRRFIARFAVICVLLVAAAGVTGCGSASHYVANVVAHKIANHYATTPAARRRVNRAFCVYSVYRAFHDFRHHHFIFGALNAHQALKNCEAGFSKNARHPRG
jgi:hypothetical protein